MSDGLLRKEQILKLAKLGIATGDEVDRLRAENAELRADAERYRFLRDLKVNSFTIGFNDDSAPNYKTVAQNIEESQSYNKHYSDVPPEELEQMKATNCDWQLQIYPNTPVGFNVYIGATLDSVIDKARGEGE